MAHVKNTLKFAGFAVAFVLLASALTVGAGAIFSAFGLGGEIAGFGGSFAAHAVLIIILIRLVKKKSAAEKTPKTAADIPLSVSICVFFAAYPIVYYTLARIIFGGNSQLSPSYIEEYQSVWGFAFSLLKSSVFVPVMEELLFRRLGFLQLGNMNGAAKISITAVMFALVHLPKGFYTGDTLIAGLLLAALFLRTNVLLYCMLAHSAHNLAAAVINRLNYERLIPWDYNLDLYVYPVWLSVLCTAALIASGTFFILRYKKIYIKNINNIIEKD
ncbi:MAG: CPBP family intramembrane metalloprotease [Muribaculaceae bacterium]|nr:CPBP family intramembrane metalloprotease [Muribaculaceae bacterium]MCM1479566.1 CPBP family intramembrane metalloprotease [Muribaculaceae bacterium]